jgi:hypothetical protein
MVEDKCNTICLAMNSKGGRLSPQISSKEDEGRERHDLRFGACSTSHPLLFNSICPKNSKNSRLKELKEIYWDMYMWRRKRAARGVMEIEGVLFVYYFLWFC